MADRPLKNSSQPKSKGNHAATNKPPVRKRGHFKRKAVIDDMAARSAYARAKAWADSPAGTPYGEKAKP